KGHATAKMVLATFAETKVAQLSGRDPTPHPRNLKGNSWSPKWTNPKNILFPNKYSNIIVRNARQPPTNFRSTLINSPPIRILRRAGLKTFPIYFENFVIFFSNIFFSFIFQTLPHFLNTKIFLYFISFLLYHFHRFFK
ncbi:MAG TPA: hypothetical protein DD706_06115, partial [Nitrospiraceae bacterium]|nr:hypothetical protein [Nitrospiraceae bacterium]